MKFQPRPLLCVAICSLAITIAHGQHPVIKTSQAALDSFRTQYPQEKVFLHTDKAFYSNTESVWFKLYCMLDGEPSQLSQVAYVDLVDGNGSVLEKRMMPLKKGVSHNSIELTNIPTGKYMLRAYTLWMLNFQEFIFTKEISVSGNTNPSSANRVATSYVVGFYPEGGDLVSGVPTTVAFKAHDSRNQPVTVSGRITDGSGNTVATINSVHDGMGSFELTPQAGKNYVLVTTINDAERRFKLPEVKTEGALLHVTGNSPTKIFFQVNRSETNKDRYNELYVIGQQNNKVVYAGTVNFEEGQTAALLYKKDLLPGILQLTLFDKDNKPLSERLVFVKNIPAGEDVLFTSDTLNLSPRQKNKYSFLFQDATAMSASVSITDPASQGPDRNNIVAQLLFNSDLHGYIYNPSYYVANGDSNTLRSMDLLMLTNGWRRFNWTKILSGEYPTLKYIAEPGITLSGKVTKLINQNASISNGKIDIITKSEDSTIILNTTSLNSKGEFFIPNLNFKKRAKVYFQGTNNHRAEANTMTILQPAYIDTLKSLRQGEYPSLGLAIDPILLSNANKPVVSFSYTDESGKILSNVTVTARRLSAEDSTSKLYSSALFYNSDNTIVLDDKKNYFSIWTLLKSKVAGLVVEGDPNNPDVYFQRYSHLSNAFSSGEDDNTETGIIYFLNEVKVSKDVIESLAVNDVSLIKVYKGLTGWALGASQGAIAIYTKNGANTADPRDKSFEMEYRTGYSVEREFYSPDYSKPDADAIKTDNRTTLYWNPEMKIDARGRTSISFYTSDITKEVLVTLEGMDANGKLVHFERTLKAN